MTDAKQLMAQKTAKIAAGAVVCVESEIRGDVTIGARTVVHPKARIIAEAGPIIIGEGNLIEEQALIINRNLSHGDCKFLIKIIYFA
uniref:Dynactin subunit 6 n=1 Tax=Amphiprion ocellaris TaxID=80972 RepID=A0AAQ5XEB0_AMPOC